MSAIEYTSDEPQRPGPFPRLPKALQDLPIPTPEEMAAQVAEDDERERQRQVEAMMERIIPPAYLAASVHDLSVGGEEATAIRTYAEHLGQRRAANLLLTGPVGAGKTWAAWAVIRYLIQHRIFATGWHASDLLASLRPHGTQSIEQGGEGLSHFVAPEVLFIDDLGTERVTEFSVETMTVLLNGRMAFPEKSTIITTNQDLADLSDMIGERAFSRLTARPSLHVPIVRESQR